MCGTPPVTIPVYRIEELIAQWNQARLYKEVMLSTARRLAIKVMPAALARGNARARLDRETNLMPAFEHANLVGVVDRGQTADGWGSFPCAGLLTDGTWTNSL